MRSRELSWTLIRCGFRAGFEEVVPVNELTLVLLWGVTVGR